MRRDRPGSGESAEAAARRLADAGVGWVNHNLNTSERFYPKICTTHTYADRVATVHAREGRMQAVVTWREAQTALLDADGRSLASVGRNALAQGWTMSLRVDDPDVLLMLGPDGGRMTLVAAVDREHDPWARVGNSPLRVERCDVALGV